MNQCQPWFQDRLVESILPAPHKWRTLLLLALAELLGMAVWFSASAVVPALTTAWGLNDSGRAWLTLSVQIGFVVGAFWGWEWAFAFLALGPAVGVWAMSALRRSPAAARLAGGKG